MLPPHQVLTYLTLTSPSTAYQFWRTLCGVTGRSLHCQVENHVRTKFATPIFYAIDNYKNYDIFSTYT